MPDDGRAPLAPPADDRRRAVTFRRGACRGDQFAARLRAWLRGRTTGGGRIWRAIAIFLIGGMLGTGFGVALGFFLFPYVFPPPPAAETITEDDRSALVATGTFIHADPSDPIHYGEGKVSVYEKAVFLEPDFKVGPGPAYHVYLVPKATIRASARRGGHDVCRPRRAPRLRGQPALPDPGRRRTSPTIRASSSGASGSRC